MECRLIIKKLLIATKLQSALILTLVFLLTPLTLMAQTLMEPSSVPYANSPTQYLEKSYPTQQFVTAETPEPPVTVTAENGDQAKSKPVAPTMNSAAPTTPIATENPYPMQGVFTPIQNPNVSPNTIGGLEYGKSPPTVTNAENIEAQNGFQPAQSGLPFSPPPENPKLQPSPSQDVPSTPANPSGLADETLFVPNQPLQIFKGGLDDKSFIQCQKVASGACMQAKDKNQFAVCLAQVAKQAVCQQFMAFAELSSFSAGDDMDVFQKYDEANLTLIHLTRGQSQYPGDYFIIGNDGSFVNVNTGKEVQALDIKTDANYPKLNVRYRDIQLWSLIDRLPRIEPLMTGLGVRLIFSYQLRNGCATCDLVGYADIAFDFAENGRFKQVNLLRLRELQS